MSPNPKASVIITTFNRPRFLGGATKSVLDQSLSDFELIIVDDGSLGRETEDAVRQFSDPRIRYIKNPQNLGSAESLNVGLRAAKGEFIAILDDDDVWIDKEKLAKQVNFLNVHSDYALVATNIIAVDYRTEEELSRSHNQGNDADLREKVLGQNPFAHSSVMYRRETALKAGGYDANLSRGKDYDLWLKLGLLGGFAVLSDYAVKYREAGAKDRDLVSLRYKDARATLRVIWRYRNSYPGFWRSFSALLSRVVIFKVLTFFPGIYNWYKK